MPFFTIRHMIAAAGDDDAAANTRRLCLRII